MSHLLTRDRCFKLSVLVLILVLGSHLLPLAQWQDTTSADIGPTMAERLATLKQGCHKHGLDLNRKDSLLQHQSNSWEYLVAIQEKLVWCNIFKSGSSSWTYVFNKLANYSEAELKQEVRHRRD